MKTLKKFLLLTLFLFLAFCQRPQTIVEKGNQVDKEVLARKLVNQCALIHEGEFVGISGGIRDFELLEDLVINVRKAGAFPILFIGSDRISRRSYTDVPAKYDSQIPELDLKLVNLLTADIAVEYGEKPDLLADIPPERMMTRGKAYDTVYNVVRKRNMKGVNLGNGLYPTEARAKEFGLTLAELSDIFWKGVNTDYSRLEESGAALKAKLSAGKEIHITNPNGTDIKMSIENRPVFVSDGVLHEKELTRGYAGSQVFLPAGEVYLTPVSGTAEGKVVVDLNFYQGKEIKGTTLVFKEGKMVSMTAESGLEPMKKMYDAAESGKEEFSFIDIGINPDVQIKPGSKMVSYIPAGMFTMGIGNNTWAGGENKNTFGFDFHIPGCTVVMDGKTLVKDGVIEK
jgi:leucyl aminopeptidase (aminopeptidase T)